MSSNKKGLRLSSYISFFSFIGTIFINEKSWWYNFSFALLGSALLSVCICWSNYRTIKLELVEKIVFGTYKMNNDGFSSLYNINNDLSLEQIENVISILSSYKTIFSTK